jgi:general secretion pathway protein A
MYERFFGLSDRPFEVTPDSKFLFLSSNHLEVMNTMLSGIRERRGLIVVTGEVGTGKTILVHSVLERLEEGVKSAFIFHTTITFEELLKAILVELEQPTPRKDEKILWEQLVQYSKQVSAQEETLAIIIDEAHKLDETVIEKLLQRVIEPRSRHIQIILVGQPELEKKLGSSAVSRFRRSGIDRRKSHIPVYSLERRSGQDRRDGLQERIEVRLEIEPLSDDESKRYIEHRLRLSGGKTSDLFTEEAVNLLCHQARGIPRVLNILCDNALLTAYGLSKQKIDVDVVQETIRALEGMHRKKILPFLHSLQTVRMQPSLWKVLLAGFLLLCLAGFFMWLNRDSGQPTLETSQRGIIQKSAPKASRPSTSSKTEQKSEGESRSPAAPVETGTPATETLSATSHPATSSMGTRGKAEFEEIVTVKVGETIFELCRRYYGLTNATLMDIVLDFNPGLENANLIRVNQKIRLPRITEELLILENPDQTYQIHAGTYADPDASRRYSNVSALKEKEIEVIPRKVSPGDTWYRVVIGRFDTRDEALKMIRLLKGRGLVPSPRIVSGKETTGKSGVP